MTIFYFTGTGNSLAIAKSIGGSLISIPQVLASLVQGAWLVCTNVRKTQST